MNKSAIKNFAVRARKKLIEDITQKVYELGITENGIKEIEIFEGGFRVAGNINIKTYKNYEIKQRERLILKIKEDGYEQVIEEVAYTWFNRFIALRFMEVNEYLPTGIKVLSSVDEHKKEPDIIKEALNLELDIDKDLVYKLIDANDMEDLYKYLLVKQCNELGKIMPMVFEEISDYTELLLPDNLLSENSVIRDLVDAVDEGDYKDQVEIIGWMYQYYISEKKDEVFADLKKNKKITKENIPAATQLFTPKWIVKYMVENSLGRLWLESHPDEDLQDSWKYYLQDAEQEKEVQKQLNELKNPDLKPEEIKILDPSMGSGHILVYAFDVLYDIYMKANYSEREIPQLILEKNLFGLDIDDRAGQLSAFALMMKARSKNKRIFRRKVNLNVCSIQESNGISNEAMEYFAGENKELTEDVKYLIDVFFDAKEYGSILDVKKIDFNAVEKRIEEIKNEDTKLFNLQFKEEILEKMPSLLTQGRIMSDKYDVVCTNPPYMGSNGMDAKLSDYVNKKYPDSKSDLFAVFIERCNQMNKENCYQAMITQHSWMFISSYEKLRKKILNNDIINMAHLGARAFEEIGGEVVQTTAFIFQKVDIKNYTSTFIRLVNYNSQYEKESAFFSKLNKNISIKENFSKIPGVPIAYWISDKVLNCFYKEKKLIDICEPRSGLSTSDNKRFLRLWFEIEINKSSINDKNNHSNYKWIPMNKGGSFRRWYGNNEWVINYEDNGKEIKEYASKLYKSYSRTIKNIKYYFKKSITWSAITSGMLSVRNSDEGFIFGSGGYSAFVSEEYERFVLALLNNKVNSVFFEAISPTLNFEVGHLNSIPIKFDKERKTLIDALVTKNTLISKNDWDSFETSWDFQRHPFLKHLDLEDRPLNLEAIFNIWETETEESFNQLKHNEEELNRIFIEIYGLQDELTPEVEDKDITIRKADREKDIKSFISYAVGCMFGRYSLDEDGLIYAGGEFKLNKYKTFIPTKDNILIIADDDYFEDDILNRFIEFVQITFGTETLEENLDYIAETLRQKTNETSRQTIRKYFLKDFYNDHLKIYQKRPIYWQFDSGKQNGFKTLIYMHRYDSATVSGVRVDYLHKLQRKYESEAKHLEMMLESDLSPREAATAKKKKDLMLKQIQECLSYDPIIAHIANQKIEIDLDDGVVINYQRFQNIEVPQGEGKKQLKANLLSKI